jgi:hypothetical protein
VPLAIKSLASQVAGAHAEGRLEEFLALHSTGNAFKETADSSVHSLVS